MLTVTLAPWGDEARLRACHVVVARGLPGSSAVAPHGGRVARCIEVTLQGRASLYLDITGERFSAAAVCVAAGRPFSSENLDIRVEDSAAVMILEDNAEAILAALAPAAPEPEPLPVAAPEQVAPEPGAETAPTAEPEAPRRRRKGGA